MDILVMNTTVNKDCKPKEPDGKKPEDKNGVPIIKIFFIFLVILIVVLAGLKCLDYTKELLICIGIAGVVSDVLMCILIAILAGGGGSERARIIWKTIGYAVMPLLIINALAIYYLYKYCFPPPKPGFEQSIEQINQRLAYLQIETSRLEFCPPPRSHLPVSYAPIKSSFSSAPPEQPKSQYLITVKDNTLIPFYHFDGTEYTLESAGFRNMSAEPVCRFIDNCYDEKDTIGVSLNKLRTGMQGLPGRGCMNPNVPEVNVELIYIIRKLSKLANARVEILIRGYADGKPSEWEKPLWARYAYHEFRIYRTAGPDSLSPSDGLYYPDKYYVYDYYMNKDLPNLRARFVQLDLIDPFLSQCNMSPTVSTYVIEGKEVYGFDPLNRKVQIYILLF